MVRSNWRVMGRWILDIQVAGDLEVDEHHTIEAQRFAFRESISIRHYQTN